MEAKKIQEQINALTAKLWAVENNIINSSAEILVEEILNLQQGCGEGYTNGDYYAPDRYYSKIHGVKNIRFGCEDQIIVKISSPIGGLLPDEIKISGKIYSLIITRSTNFSSEMDY